MAGTDEVAATEGVETTVDGLSVFGAMQTAQCKWRNASGATQMANPNPNPNPLALRHLHCAVCIAPNTDSPVDVAAVVVVAPDDTTSTAGVVAAVVVDDDNVSTADVVVPGDG